MTLLLFFAALVFPAVSRAVGQKGFLSIDCGREANYSGSTEDSTGIAYVSDGSYIDTGENHRIAADQESEVKDEYLKTVRSFPSGIRNCYALPTQSGSKYLVRMEFFYGNYDGKKSSSLKFNLNLGVNQWVTLNDAESGNKVYEAVFMAWASWAPVCLVNTGGGTPFVSSVDLRLLGDALYPPVRTNESLSSYDRSNMGADTVDVNSFRYPTDPFDRIWFKNSYYIPGSVNISTEDTIVPDASFAVPSPILQRAVSATRNNTDVTLTWKDERLSYAFMVFLYFADFQKLQLRQFDAYINGNRLGDKNQSNHFSPLYLAASSIYSSSSYRATDGKYNITLKATTDSVLPPMLNAIDIYTVIPHDSPTTFPTDFDAIMAIKHEYGVKKNWMGDPCFPSDLAWDGVKCNDVGGNSNTLRIISLDLSDSNLHGVVSNNFTLLTAITYLNLSGNQLNGPIPNALCKSNAGSLVFGFDSDGDVCNKTSPSRNKAVVLAVSVAVPVMAVIVLVLAYVIWRVKRKPNISAKHPPREEELESPFASRENHGDPLPKTENRRFTYNELEKFTNKFERLIGKGGFGSVYYGRLDDDSEVAIKMRSKSSTHGLVEFFAEVRILTKVYHRNLVSLVGHCLEKDHLALVYSYMAQGNLCAHLRGNYAGSETLNWRTRVRVLLEAAQGLDYLHKGCSPPIIHRDVKSSNILLGQNLQAKISDFGLSKTYLCESQTHISATAAGTGGYIDPEYYQTGRLAESSDVYSFGIVLLEVATGEPPILAGQGHIVQRVKKKITTGNISSVADVRLEGAYDVNSMWKVVDTAMMCTANGSAQRPTMASVVVHLRESLALEEASGDSGVSTSLPRDTTVSVSNFGPSER